MSLRRYYTCIIILVAMTLGVNIYLIGHRWIRGGKLSGESAVFDVDIDLLFKLRQSATAVLPCQ